jgi:pimeloyl-ACP methyl ester carboxylesterase
MSASVGKVNGVELGYETFGEGDPLILLHGGFGTLDMFGPNVPALAQMRHVIGVDSSRTGARQPRTGRCGSRRWPTTWPS